MGGVNVKCLDKELQEFSEKGLFWFFVIVKVGGIVGEGEV